MRILYVTTTFPVLTETFLQREVRAFREHGVELSVISLHRGESDFEGLPVTLFSKWRLLSLFWKLPWVLLTRWKSVRSILGPMWTKLPANPMNMWENLLGFGAAIVMEKEIRRIDPDCIHCVWTCAPAAFGWLEKQLTDKPFTTGAHAYDIFEDGGDWFLSEKLASASLVHVSTQVAEERVAEVCDRSKIELVRRGINNFPNYKNLREDRSCLRIISIARLVEKKGFPFQLEVYKELSKRGIAFEAEIIGEGPLRQMIEDRIQELNLGASVRLAGRLSQEETLERLQWADVFVHTGIIARSGDRDGLPNVIPEAMASGAVVLATPVSGVVEAVIDCETGALTNAAKSDWADVLERVIGDDEYVAALRNGGRAWVEENFNARINSGRLLKRIKAAIDYSA